MWRWCVSVCARACLRVRVRVRVRVHVRVRVRVHVRVRVRVRVRMCACARRRGRVVQGSVRMSASWALKTSRWLRPLAEPPDLHPLRTKPIGCTPCNST